MACEEKRGKQQKRQKKRREWDANLEREVTARFGSKGDAQEEAHAGRRANGGGRMAPTGVGDSLLTGAEVGIIGAALAIGFALGEAGTRGKVEEDFRLTAANWGRWRLPPLFRPDADEGVQL